MRSVISDKNNPGRHQILAELEKKNKEFKELLAKVRIDKTYLMPQEYINWQTLSTLVSVAIYNSKSGGFGDTAIHLYSALTASWFCLDSPLYCITSELIEAFDNTEIFSRLNILFGWRPSIPVFLIAVPRKLIYTSEFGEVDHLIVHCYDQSCPNKGLAKNIKMSNDSNKYNLTFQFFTITSTGDAIGSCFGIDFNGNVPYYELSNDIRIKNNDIKRLSNLIVNILLALEFSPDLFANATQKEVKQSKGFGVSKISSSNIQYPRWIGKNYQRRTVPLVSDLPTTHVSPCAHWRRGHWRVLESGDGKRWKEDRRIWIEPVLVKR